GRHARPAGVTPVWILDPVDVFAAGTHGGTLYTLAHLDEMARNFAELSPRRPVWVALGHSEHQPELRALGLRWAGRAQRLWRWGDGRGGRGVGVPDAVAELIRRRSYARVSAEAWEDFAEGGRRLGRVLRRVALLGGELPALKGLAPLPMPEW